MTGCRPYPDSSPPTEFLEIVGPIRDGWLAVLDAAEVLRETHGRQPAAESSAAVEASRQSEIAGEWGESPVDDARAIVWTHIASAEGCIAAFADLLVTDRLGPYVLDILARSAIENLARALWLGEPALGRDLRVKRAETERIFSLVEQGRLDRNFKSHSKDREQTIVSTAHALGWSVLPASKRAPRRLVERRSATRLVGDLYLEQDEHDFGTFLYRLLSATGHGTIYALVRRLVRVTDHPSALVGLAAVTVRTQDVRALSHALLLGYTALFDRWHLYLGWLESHDLDARVADLRDLLGPLAGAGCMS